MNLLITILLLIPTLVDIRNNNVDFNKDEQYLVLYLCGIACKDCYIEIDNLIQKDKFRKYKYYCAIYTSKNDILGKKELLEFYKLNVNPDKFVFLRSQSELKILENQLTKKYYPIIITNINGTVKLYKYEDLFEDNKKNNISNVINSFK